MAKVRWIRSEVTGTATPGKVRWFRSEVTGTVPAAGKVRWYRSSASGTVGVVLNALTDRTVEPMSSVTITAVPAVGSAIPASYTWRMVSGPVELIINSTIAAQTFIAPSDIAGVIVILGVVGTFSGVASTEQFTTITVYPQLDWALVDDVWVPLAPTISL